MGSPFTDDGGPVDTVITRPVTSGVSGDFLIPGGGAIVLTGLLSDGLVAQAVAVCGEAQPDNDGGVGGACHVPDSSPWSSAGAGCAGTAGYNTVIGDTVSSFGNEAPGLGLLVLAGCDYGTTMVSGGGLVTCAGNAVLQQALGRFLPGGECYEMATGGLGFGEGTVVQCGADGSVDAIRAGLVTPTSGFTPPGPGACAADDGYMTLFTVAGIEAREPALSAPTVGWVSTV